MPPTSDVINAAELPMPVLFTLPLLSSISQGLNFGIFFKFS